MQPTSEIGLKSPKWFGKSTLGISDVKDELQPLGITSFS